MEHEYKLDKQTNLIYPLNRFIKLKSIDARKKT